MKLWKPSSKITKNSNLFKFEKFISKRFNKNFNENINESLLYTICNIIENENKFLLITSKIEINKMEIELTDLKSRLNNFFFLNLNQS